VWATRLRDHPLPELVTGSSVIFRLTAAAAENGQSIHLLGGKPGVPERAAAELARQHPGLQVAGTDTSPPGFDREPEEFAVVRARLEQARSDIVCVGFGLPKQERVTAALPPGLPTAWFVGRGAAIPFAAGALPRAPEWMRRLGLEWLYRLISEPRRLFRRYVLADLPFAVRLLLASVPTRLRLGPHVISRMEAVS
jgi:N-acetylglucosaminyldiphosphoundecaprenol N-acetyl-beta-D-mannosaminyltransferase